MRNVNKLVATELVRCYEMWEKNQKVYWALEYKIRVKSKCYWGIMEDLCAFDFVCLTPGVCLRIDDIKTFS